MQARMMGMFGQATSKGFGRSVSVGMLMLHGGKQKIGQGTEEIGGKRRKRGMTKIGGQRGLGQSGGRRGVINIRGKDGVSVPGTQLVDRAVLLSTRHGIRHCFNGK